jgi:hypothetical protein
MKQNREELISGIYAIALIFGSLSIILLLMIYEQPRPELITSVADLKNFIKLDKRITFPFINLLWGLFALYYYISLIKKRNWALKYSRHIILIIVVVFLLQIFLDFLFSKIGLAP